MKTTRDQISTRHSSLSLLVPFILSLKHETSFVAALERFLHHQCRSSSSSPFPTASEEDVLKIRRSSVCQRARYILQRTILPVDLPVRVHVYEMPTKFTYDLLCLFRNTYSDTDNLTSNGSIHRLIDRSGDDEGKAVDCWQFSVLVYILLLHLEGLEAKENANQAVKFMALRAAINQQLTQCFL